MPCQRPVNALSTSCQRPPGGCQRPVNVLSTSCQRPVNACPKSVNALSTLCQKAKNVKHAKIRPPPNLLNTNNFTIPPQAPENHPDSFCPCHTKQNFSRPSQNARRRRGTPLARAPHVRMPSAVSKSCGNPEGKNQVLVLVFSPSQRCGWRGGHFQTFALSDVDCPMSRTLRSPIILPIPPHPDDHFFTISCEILSPFPRPQQATTSLIAESPAPPPACRSGHPTRSPDRMGTPLTPESEKSPLHSFPRSPNFASFLLRLRPPFPV